MFNDEDWDLGTCLKNECYRKQLRVPHPLRSWIDLRATYKVCIVQWCLRPCKIIFVPRLNKSKSEKLSCHKML